MRLWGVGFTDTRKENRRETSSGKKKSPDSTGTLKRWGETVHTVQGTAGPRAGRDLKGLVSNKCADDLVSTSIFVDASQSTGVTLSMWIWI